MNLHDPSGRGVYGVNLLAERDAVHEDVRRAQLEATLFAPRVQVLNYVPASDGRVAAVCACCGHRSRPVKPDADGEPDLWAMPRNWSQAPYPADCQHDDGSVGSTYTCPTCNARLHKGETLQRRAYLHTAGAAA